jgi:hypothetical protein
MLECKCVEWDGESGWGYFTDNELRPLDDGKRKKRCKSCGELIAQGEDCLKIARERACRDDIEGEIRDWAPVAIANWYLCKGCGEIFLNLENAGYCPDPCEDQRWLLKQHWDNSNHGGWFNAKEG